MDIRRLIKMELYPIFLELNNLNRIHSEVWLGRHIYWCGHKLYVRMWPGLRGTNEEAARILEIIQQRLKPEFSKEIDVRVLNWSTGFEFKVKKDVMVYYDETALFDSKKDGKIL